MSQTRGDSIAYVAHTMHEADPPPVGETGALGWLRANLFATPVDALLTILALAALTLALPQVFGWAVTRGVWDANSLTECRQIITATFGEGERGACWAVVAERWPQLIFGFYPPELYWRPILAFILLGVALAPVLFDLGALKKPLLWFSLAYPVVAYILLWGGLGLEGVESSKFGGFLLTLIIGVTGIAFSLPIGVALALGRQSDMVFIRGICVGFIEFIRGVPLITLLFVASTLLNYFMPPGTNFDIILRVLIMVTLFASAYMAEVIRGGLAALPKGQYEAGDALGLSYWKKMRLVILPQALKISIPGIVNTFIGLFKDTTLVMIIGLMDPLGLTNQIRANSDWNGIVWELYAVVAVLFFLCCFGMSRYSMFLERKLRAGDRR